MAARGAGSDEGELRVSGLPIHTRLLEIEVSRLDAGRLGVRGLIVDTRKFGFVPTGGDLQTAGTIHDMSLAARVDEASLVLESLVPSQRVVAFEASERTGGDSCRDSIGLLPKLEGARLDRDFPKKLSATYGGALGCSHLLTLAFLLASTVPRAVDWERAVAGGLAPRREGERLFKRTLVLDGLDAQGGAAMDVAVQLNDVHTRPYDAVAAPLDRFGRQHEVRIAARARLSDLAFESLRGLERVRVGTPLVAGGWEAIDAELEAFVGAPAIYGLGALVRERYGSDPDREALRDTLLGVAPGLIQCMAAYAGRMVEGDGSMGEGPSILQLGGLPNSCYIWREGGPGLRMRGEREAGGRES